ncbi:MAG TPA: beta-L-arabinofuranosidase domain-containing protein [Puia sp.]|nr:beta-L-arabinofuranosidase domain-containing protein [Puia sp.]
MYKNHWVCAIALLAAGSANSPSAKGQSTNGQPAGAQPANGQTTSRKKDYGIQNVPFTNVRLTDNLWSGRIETNRTVTIPASFSRCESTGRVKNFTMAAEKKGKFCTTYPFDDTDIYKTIEGASYSLSVHPDKALDRYVDSLITLIGKAQEPDGYLYTARTIDPLHPHAWSGPVRWINEHDNSHELYNSGHLYEAAYAHFVATGKRTLLDIALKNADLLLQVFGEGKMEVAPGHEIVEMGLAKLYRVTGKKEYLTLAKFFLDARGKRGYDPKSPNPWKNGSYWQDNKPVALQDEAEGHAVRAMYLYSAMADIAALTGDTVYENALGRIWNNTVSKKIYVQGGLGAVGDGERFGDNYELPNTTAYNETCASVGAIFWNQRMFQLHGESKYIDVLEKILYNNLLSGVGLDGKSFFYTNALQINDDFSHQDREPQRSGWFECSCCPTNIARLLPALPGYIYAQEGDRLFVNLFISSKVGLTLDHLPVKITQANHYPWDGALCITVDPVKPVSFPLLIRIPGWAKGRPFPSDLYTFENAGADAATAGPSSNDKAANTDGGSSAGKIVIHVNGAAFVYKMENGYAVISRVWKKGDVVKLTLPMNVSRVVANPAVKNDIGKVALERGPVVYCAEGIDNNNKTSNLILPVSAQFTATFQPQLLGGVEVLESTAMAVKVGRDGYSVRTEPQHFIAVPYYAWANRSKCEMNVWFPERILGLTLLATK